MDKVIFSYTDDVKKPVPGYFRGYYFRLLYIIIINLYSASTAVQANKYYTTTLAVKLELEAPGRMASELQTQNDGNPTEASVSSTLTMEHADNVNGYAFRFKLPSDGLALRSVAIVDGAPELRFAASPKVPTISEEDMAVAIRLAAEGKRPEFFYIGIPFGPFSGRQYKQYIPQWLRGTSFGESLADADWNMKCLSIGARAKDHESLFSAWQETSNLDNLATCLDFPSEKPSGSIKLSCKYATVEKTENELVFPKDPVMQIIADKSSTYTKYITAIYPSVAYHDEPLFLKMQELIKLVLAAEWLVDEKAVKISREWMMKYSTAPKQKGAVAVAKSLRSKAKRPPREFVPSPTVVNRPSSDVTVKTVAAERYRHRGRGRCYGWHDKSSHELVMYTAKGEQLLKQESLKTSLVLKESKGEEEEAPLLWINFPLPLNDPSPSMTKVGESLLSEFKALHSDTDEALTVAVNVHDTDSHKDGVELKLKRNHILPAPLLPLPEREVTLKVTVHNYDMLFSDLDPNRPHWVGYREVPNVKSWNELHNETVPWPCVWQAPYPGSEVYTASGGVTTREIPFRNTTAEREIPTKDSKWVDAYKRSGTQLTVRAQLLADKGIYNNYYK